MKIIENLDDHVFASFYHVKMQPSKQGIQYTVHAKLKHGREPPHCSQDNLDAKV